MKCEFYFCYLYTFNDVKRYPGLAIIVFNILRVVIVTRRNVRRIIIIIESFRLPEGKRVHVCLLWTIFLKGYNVF